METTANKSFLKNEEKLFDSVLVLTFLAALFYSLWAASVGWHAPIMQEHSFRQTQTAISAYWLAEGGSFLRYETPVLGAPWLIPFEFPLYQGLVALVKNAFGIPLEQAGRLVGRLFFYLSLFPIMGIAFCCGFRGKKLLLPATLFLVSPLYLFWSRTFMIEMTATFFGLAYLASSLYWAKKKTAGWLLSALLFGVLAALVKSTTYLTFGIATGLYFVWLFLIEKRRDQIVSILVLLALPLFVGMAWAKYTDYVKLQNPLAEFITSGSLMQWNFGTLEQRLSGDFWYMIFRKTIHESIGHRTTWLLSLALVAWWRKSALLYFLAFFLFLSAPLIFTNLHIAHNYYANANGVFLVLALAVAIAMPWQWGTLWAKRAAFILYGFALVFAIREYFKQDYYLQLAENVGPIGLGQEVQKVVAKEDVIVVIGWDWDSTVPYYSERRAIMLTQKMQSRLDLFEKSLRNTEADGKKIGAAILCNEARSNPKVLADFPQIGKRIADSLCEIYEWRDRPKSPQT